MKPAQLTWPEYLQEGIANVAGTTPDGTHDYATAGAIFEECTLQDESPDIDPDTEVEAHFRRAYALHLDKQPKELVNMWLHRGNGLLPKVTQEKTRVQCQLLETIIKEAERTSVQRGEKYLSLWNEDVDDFQLRGDIASQLARVYFLDGLTDLACKWILRAEECYDSVPHPDAAVHHARVELKVRGARIFAQRSKELWREGRQLFREGKVPDHRLWEYYWTERGCAALKAWQPFRALWYFTQY